MAKTYASAIIPAPPAAVWAVVRDFNALPKWTPFVAESRIEQNKPSDQVGCIRNFRLKDGGRIREQLLELSDYAMSFGYSILESPMGVENYYASLRLSPVTDVDHTFAEWEAEFDAAPEREDALVQQIGRNVFAAGLQALKQRFSR
ncbi:MAG: SRPBCC family protein [Hyphomicrobiales bacterium]|nr:SRPBCC family protein [Hyphomicrobiales bacterium]MBV8663134.1 SRPBCC family protein [Hyphomicrobiales bacterium]